MVEKGRKERDREGGRERVKEGERKSERVGRERVRERERIRQQTQIECKQKGKIVLFGAVRMEIKFYEPPFAIIMIICCAHIIKRKSIAKLSVNCRSPFECKSSLANENRVAFTKCFFLFFFFFVHICPIHLVYRVLVLYRAHIRCVSLSQTIFFNAISDIMRV